jgi:hypothetical protein
MQCREGRVRKSKRKKKVKVKEKRILNEQRSKENLGKIAQTPLKKKNNHHPI